MFDIDYLTDSMNYIPVSLENQANPHAGASEVTNSAGTSQTPSFNASEEKDEDVELIVVPSTVRSTEEKAESRKSSTKSKKEEILTELQQEKKASSIDTYTRIFHKSETGIFDEASYDEEGVITDFNSLPIEIEVSPTPTLGFHNNHPKKTAKKQSQRSTTLIICLFSSISCRNLKRFLSTINDSWFQAIPEEFLHIKAATSMGSEYLPHGMKGDWLLKRSMIRSHRGTGSQDLHISMLSKEILMILKGKPHLDALWYPRESPFDLKHSLTVI
ncbi:hypothetical protein Tco_0642503 [Tanacetum coccineum]